MSRRTSTSTIGKKGHDGSNRHARSHTPPTPLNLSAIRAFRPVLTPAAILLAVALALTVGPALPPSLSGLKTLGPYVVLLLGTGMGVWFNRGRAFIALASLLAAFVGYSIALEYGPASFAARAVFTAAAILVPLNFLLALVSQKIVGGSTRAHIPQGGCPIHSHIAGRHTKISRPFAFIGKRLRNIYCNAAQGINELRESIKIHQHIMVGPHTEVIFQCIGHHRKTAALLGVVDPIHPPSGFIYVKVARERSEADAIAFRIKRK